MTALRIALTARQEALDQHELGLVARQERIDGMGERVREVQKVAGCREEAVGRRPEERSKRVEESEEEMETRSAQLGGLNASTSALGSSSWTITLQVRSVFFRVLGDKTSLFLIYSYPPSQ